MACLVWQVGWVGMGWFWLPSRRPPSGLSHRPKGALILRSPGSLRFAEVVGGFGHGAPLLRRDQASPGRRDGSQHHRGLVGSRPTLVRQDTGPGGVRTHATSLRAAPTLSRGHPATPVY